MPTDSKGVSVFLMERRITDDIDRLKAVLPGRINQALEAHNNIQNLLEIILDMGRVPTARYLEGEIALADTEVTRKDLDNMIRRLHFDADNRAGMTRTLHRISAIRNRRGEVVGLTCRVGRAVYGTIDILEDLIKSGKNLLILGPPGVGKTTMLREAARVLADEKRVVIVDTSNEIGGDGDVPHPAVGKARRMQVSHPEKQHEVMIEAVENHNPEVIVIDEIGRELEALAARTIAERGVQLIGTAHGNALQNLMLNPTLSDLIGGIESVTLSDEEARRRGTQKTVLERRAPPTFQILVELQTRDQMAVHPDIAESVDGLLRGKPQQMEQRTRDANGVIQRQMVYAATESRLHNSLNKDGKDKDNGARRTAPPPSPKQGRGSLRQYALLEEYELGEDEDSGDFDMSMALTASRRDLQPVTVYAYGVARNRLLQAARRLNVPLNVSDEFGNVDAIVTLKTYYRNRPKMVTDAERRGMPIYVLRANTVSQMENFLVDLFKLEERDHDPFGAAMLETQTAIQRIQAGENLVDLTPQAAHVRRQQHRMARQAGVYSESYGDNDHRYVRLSRSSMAS